MSTKTSFKRIAAVAAVALTLGGFSAVSAHAAPTADTLAVSSTAVAATSSVQSQVAVTQTFLAQASADAGTVTAALISAPAGNIAVPSFETPTVTGYTDARATRASSAGASMTTVVSSGTYPAYVAATYNLDFTPVVAGTYIVKLIPTVNAGATAYATAQTITYTVAAKPAISAAATTVYKNYAYNASVSILGSYSATSATTDAYNLACYDATALCAEIQVNESNGSTTAALTAADASPITVSVSGPATVAVNGTNTGFVSGLATGVVAVETTAQVATLGLTPYVDVWSNGTPGIATITISAGTTVLATKTVTFFHDAAKITPTVASPVLAIGANAAAITAVVSDASGTPVPNVHVYAVSDTAAVVSNSYTDCGLSSITGAVSCALTGVAAGTAKITLTLNQSSAGTSTVATVPLAVRTATALSSVKWALDSSSYTPGQLATLSVTLLGTDGLPVAPGTYNNIFTAAPTFSLAPATALTLTSGSVTVAAGSTTGTTAYTFNAPISAGALAIKATTGTSLPTAGQAVAVELDATITGGASVDAAQAAQDAAAEATDAANAATDAANNAMDSADAATAAAQDAGDKADAALAAITDLATKVSDIATQVSSLSAVVAKIAAAVAKISAKVKA